MDMHCNHTKAGCTACGKAEERHRVLLLLEKEQAKFTTDATLTQLLKSLQSKVQEDFVFISHANVTEALNNVLLNERARVSQLITNAEDSLEGWRLANSEEAFLKALSALKKHVNSNSTTLFAEQ